jgi:CMP-2-keto-3-deoxyoctulosonic acid synthetase
MIEHVRRRVLAAGLVDRVLVATDDVRICDVVRDFGGDVVLTGDAPNGTCRVRAALEEQGLPARILNVQGDMPLLDPAHVEAVAELLFAGAPIATLAVPLEGDPTDPHLKVEVGTGAVAGAADGADLFALGHALALAHIHGGEVRVEGL